ncbi:PKD domain-containing protein [Myroides odoratimimus]|uniref:PKD domain-containing protein n=1 Tax=Myroides odoratimimus TaxID=76832 RepID=UPI0038D50FAC
MKTKLILRGAILLIASLLSYSCYNESIEQVQASFEYEYVKSNQTIPVLIQYANKSTGGDSYKWEFEGGNPKESTDKNPGQVSYVKHGKYTVTLTVTNVDGGHNTTSKVIEILDSIKGDFSYTIKGSNYPPVEVSVTNEVEGSGLEYWWELEGSQLKEFKGKDLPLLIYEKEGKYDIVLNISNGQDTVRKLKTVEVAADIAVDFDWEVALSDYDYQVPVQVQFRNSSISADSYSWEFEGSSTLNSLKSNPEVVFDKVGKHRITLTASNDKKSKSLTKTIDIYENTNLYVLENVKLGNVFAHNTSEIAALYSTMTRENYFSSAVTESIAPKIDIVFVGMTSDLSMSKFMSASEIASSGLLPFKGGQQLKIINSQELCKCGVDFSISDFVAMKTDKPLQGLSIVETAGGKQYFNNKAQRVVLFETVDGRKGAIYVKDFVSVNSQYSYVLCDIKVQKTKK